MSKTLELPDDLAAMLDTPEKRAQAIEAIRDRFATATNGAATNGAAPERLSADDFFAQLTDALGIEPLPPFEEAMERARDEADRGERTTTEHTGA